MRQNFITFSEKGLKRISGLSLLISLLCFLGSEIKGQQPFQNSLFYIDPYDLNPAYIGTDGKISVTGRYRQQWTGLEGSPDFTRFNVHFPLHDYRSGFGLKMSSESIGVMRDFSMSVSGNYFIVTGLGAFSLGARGGFQSKRIDGSKLTTSTGFYDINPVDHMDDFLSETEVTDFFPVFGVGLHFFSNKLELGTVFDNYPVVNKRIEKFLWKNQPIITFHGKYYLPLVPDFRMEAFWMLKSDLIQWQNDAGMLAEWRNQFFAAFSLKGFSSVIPDVFCITGGADLGRSISLAYNYEIGFSDLNRQENGSHEIIIRWRINSFFGARRKEPIIHSPRFYE
jgi:type IX secretion system PorP/SprF family membrane protein